MRDEVVVTGSKRLLDHPILAAPPL